ncbi:MAG: glycosyltransferase [Ruthenibacterium sp.]
MKLLFVIDSIDEPNGATPNLMRTLCVQMAAEGHAVTLLEFVNDTNTHPAVQPGVQMHTAICTGENALHAIVQQGKNRGESNLHIIYKLFLHPKAAVAAFQHLVLRNGPRCRCVKKEIETLCAEESFDAVLTASAPHHTAFALAAAQISPKKMPILWDPYYTGPFYHRQQDLHLEEKVLHHCDCVFVTQLMQQQYLGTPLEKCLPKTVLLPFPALAFHPRAQSAPHTTVDCVFVGNVSRKVRDPLFVLEQFAAMTDARLRLILVGGGYEQFPPEYFAATKKALGTRLLMTGVLPQAQAEQWIAQADILVSIGNIDARQLPSKIFAYLGTGKPILHFAQHADDAALPFLRQYPLCCTLLANQPTPIKQVENFCLHAAGQTIPADEIKKTYYAFTPPAVSAVITRTFYKMSSKEDTQ